MLTRDKYRSPIGFLEHVGGVLFLRGDKMYGLYQPLSLDLQLADLVKCSSLMYKQLSRMATRVVVQSGSSVVDLPAFTSGKPLPGVPRNVPARRWAIFGDAAKEGTANPGVGGWVAGCTWRVPLSEELLELDVPVLKAAAAVINVIFAFRLLGGTNWLPVGACFEAHVDAQATAHVLIAGRARSPMMQFVHQWALGIPAFQDMLPFFIVKHCFGLGNVASDAASRGYDDVLEVVAKALSIRRIRLPAPDKAFQLVHECLKAFRKRKKVLGKRKHGRCWGSHCRRADGRSKPSRTCIGA